MILLDNKEARAAVFEHVSTVENYPGFGEPSPQMWTDYDEVLNQNMWLAHQTNRGKRELAASLGISGNKFETIFAGKSVLDIGCGEGVLSTQLAANKSTHVTALDYNPTVLAKVKPTPNLRVVEGSGYDLEHALDGQEFDVVLAAFSSLTWARNAQQARLAIESALQATKVGGATIFIPFMQHLKSHEAYHNALAKGVVPGYQPETLAPGAVEFVSESIAVEDWMRSTKLKTLRAAEESGRIACSFVASPVNKQAKPINPRLAPDHPTYEDFSVVATVLET